MNEQQVQQVQEQVQQLDPQQFVVYGACVLVGLIVGWILGRRGQLVLASKHLAKAISKLATSMDVRHS